jgi:nitrite reductase/ring-hydroxylating ferredoxin subunit
VGSAVLIGVDRWLSDRLARSGLRVLGDAGASGTEAPDAVVVDLAGEDALERVRSTRERWPDAVLAGYLTVPDADRWLAAQRAGCDLVANRGALVRQLVQLLGRARDRATRFPLAAESDLAGRLGMVVRVEDSPVGPVAVYRFEGGYAACADVCPHQGVRLSDGELEGRTLTCPGHGSQFDVTTGERTRGPADDDLARHRVVLEGGQLFLLVETGG